MWPVTRTLLPTEGLNRELMVGSTKVSVSFVESRIQVVILSTTLVPCSSRATYEMTVLSPASLSLGVLALLKNKLIN